jgi:nuclear inhibitor of protein phosphatase 1
LVLLHESVSREHAVIVLDETEGALLIDLESAQGTHVDGVKLEAYTPKNLKNGLTIQFGASTRTYIFTSNYSALQKHIRDKQRVLEQEILADAQMDL